MIAVLGVDGGNTKTDYLLHDKDGRLLAHVRAGTCSHEAIGMEAARSEMGARLGELLQMAGLRQSDVVAAAFGLAGVDQREQQAALSDVVRGLGYAQSVVTNDSFLGLKAGSESGVGVCSINGTGTAAGGIDKHGKWMQIGGLGAPSLDNAGGSYIAAQVNCAVYGEIYQFTDKTALTPLLLSLYRCDREGFHTAMSIQFQTERTVTPRELIHALFTACDQSDLIALSIIHSVADALARSAAGCAVRLDFDPVIPVVLIGSVWTKGRYAPMIDAFRAQFDALSGKQAEIHILDVPPAAGSVLWALENALGKVPGRDVRERVFSETRGL